jgi:catechol 2,3-dioxygenase-like lactoylglutathione lyase family enzyme
MWALLSTERPIVGQFARTCTRVDTTSRRDVHLRLSFLGAKPVPLLEPFDRLQTRVSYFIGNDPAKWQANLPACGGVRYKDLYPGIDPEISGDNGRVTPRLGRKKARTWRQFGCVWRARIGSHGRGDRLRLATAVSEYALPLLPVTGVGGAPRLFPSLARNQIAAPLPIGEAMGQRSVRIPDWPTCSTPPSWAEVALTRAMASQSTGALAPTSTRAVIPYCIYSKRAGRSITPWRSRSEDRNPDMAFNWSPGDTVFASICADHISAGIRISGQDALRCRDRLQGNPLRGIMKQTHMVDGLRQGGPAESGGSAAHYANPRRRNMFKLSHPVAEIALTCSNFEESFRFYHDLLGMDVTIELQVPDDMARQVGLAPTGFRQVRLRAGDTIIKLNEMPAPPPTPSAEFRAGVRWITFLVDDIAAAVAELNGRGVKFLSDPVPAPDAVGVVCAPDPDGTLIELVQRL